jgi:anti-sigma B factor antagonist
MQLREQAVRAGQVITVDTARIDAAGAIAFKDQMKALTEGREGRVLLCLDAVTFVDSSGLGALVAAMKQLAPHRRLELAGLTPGVAKLFRLTRMDHVFLIHPTLAASGLDLSIAS